MVGFCEHPLPGAGGRSVVGTGMDAPDRPLRPSARLGHGELDRQLGRPSGGSDCLHARPGTEPDCRNLRWKCVSKQKYKVRRPCLSPGLESEGGRHPNPDDGTVVIVGDLRKVYDPERTLFRSVEVGKDAHLTIQASSNLFQLYDFYGNPVTAKNRTITIPLNGLGYFLRTNGAPGSFDKLLTAISAARMEGYSPIEIIAHDLTAPIGQHPVLKLSLTNVLNRAVSGRLEARLESLSLQPASAAVALKPNETRDFAFTVTSGQPAASNIYRLWAEFSGEDGKTVHEEDMRVNNIVRRTIKVIGRACRRR